MAFDGVVISNIVKDMKERLVGGRIYKIYQPETDEICIVVKNTKLPIHHLLYSFVLMWKKRNRFVPFDVFM